MPELSKPLRIAAFIVGISSLIATLILVIIREPIDGSSGSYLATFWALLRYFTILTNGIVSYILIAAAIRGHWRSFSLLTGATLWISLVGVIYHAMLAADHNPVGIAAFTNQIHHSFVPAGTFFIWLLAKPRGYVPLKSPFLWLIFPLLYSAYTIMRAKFTGDAYPYGFSDPTIIGWPAYFATQGVLTLVFLGLGLVFRWVSNTLMRRTFDKARS